MTYAWTAVAFCAALVITVVVIRNRSRGSRLLRDTAERLTQESVRRTQAASRQSAERARARAEAALRATHERIKNDALAKNPSGLTGTISELRGGND